MGVRLFFLISLMPFSLMAKEPRDCSLKAVKDVCANHSIRPAGAVNPWRIEKESVEDPVNDELDAIISGQGRLASEEELGGGFGGPSENVYLKFQDESLKVQSELLGSLSKGSSLFKLAVTSPNTLIMVGGLAEMESARSDFMPKLTLPWPPNSNEQTTQVVSWQDFKSLYLDQLTARERSLLLTKAKGLAEKNRELAGSYSFDHSHGETIEEEESKLTPEAVRDSAIRKLKADQNKRVRKLFEQAKRYLIEEIQLRTAGGDKDKVSQLVERVKSVQLTDINFMEAECEADPDNAFYNGITNKITVCNGHSLSSDLKLIGILGHELGHAIDPCHVTGCIVHFNKSRDKIAELYSQGELPEEMQAALGYAGIDSKQMGRANQFLTQQALDRLEEEGFITVAQKGMKGTYPFDTTYRCLASRHGFVTSADTYQKSRLAKRSKRYQGDKSELTPLYVNPEFKECMENGPSEMGEAMADVFGAKVLGRYAIDHGKHDFKDLLDASGIHLRGICHGESLHGFHPYGSDRFEKILISDPLVQKAFNCKETSDSYCLKKFGHLPHQIKAGKSDRLQKSVGKEEAVK